MENNLLTHTKHETTHFDVLSDKLQTVKVSFLPFAVKINVKLNLSNVYSTTFTKWLVLALVASNILLTPTDRVWFVKCNVKM